MRIRITKERSATAIEATKKGSLLVYLSTTGAPFLECLEQFLVVQHAHEHISGLHDHQDDGHIAQGMDTADCLGEVIMAKNSCVLVVVTVGGYAVDTLCPLAGNLVFDTGEALSAPLILDVDEANYGGV